MFTYFSICVYFNWYCVCFVFMVYYVENCISRVNLVNQTPYIMGRRQKKTQELINVNDCAITRSGRVSKTINRDTNQNCVMYFAKMKKCRDKKKKQKKISNITLQKLSLKASRTTQQYPRHLWRISGRCRKKMNCVLWLISYSKFLILNLW